MVQGHPLDDDRWPWLHRIADWIGAQEAAGRSAVVTCSELDRSDPDLLRDGHPSVQFVHLLAPPAVIRQRITDRHGYSIPLSFLDSQLARQRDLEPDEPGCAVDTTGDPAAVAALVLFAVGTGGVPVTERDAFAAHADAELGIDPDALTNSRHAAAASGLSFVLGALLPLVAILTLSPDVRIPVTFVVVLFALAVTGTVSATIGGAPRVRAVARVDWAAHREWPSPTPSGVCSVPREQCTFRPASGAGQGYGPRTGSGPRSARRTPNRVHDPQGVRYHRVTLSPCHPLS
jgi:gluconokinase